MLIAGLGPVGQLLANALGARGIRVIAVDAAAGPSGEPRSATTDDEVLRIFQSVGLDGALEPHLAISSRVSFLTAGGRRLTLLETGGLGPSGHPPLAAWHQPGVERVLLAGMARFAGVEGRWGVGVESIGAERGDGIDVRLTDGSTVRAKFVVGCDGAGSRVRRLSGIGFAGSTAAQPWRVIDLQVTGEEAAALPGHVTFVGDPVRPAVSLPMAPGRHRIELLGAAPAPPLAGTVEREAVYGFHARVADRWRAGRVLLAGDAAHVMPPFGGQGLAAGARDAANLAWKLEAVLRGAPDALLDTYEAERRPAVLAATRVALAWGGLLQTRRVRLAHARDLALLAASPTPLGALLRARARPPTRYRTGALARPARRGVGDLLPQPARLDDRLGPGWAVIGELSAGERAAWEALGARMVDSPAPGGAAWAALRPDRHVFALGRVGEAERAAAAAGTWLGRW